MARVAAGDAELQSEMLALLGSVESALALGGVEALSASRSDLDIAASVSDDAFDYSDPSWVRLRAEWDRAMLRWEACCRSTEVRAEVLRRIAAPPGCDSSPTAVSFSGFGFAPLGDIALVGFAAAWPRPANHGFGLVHCLWGPAWLLPQLTALNLVRAADISSFPASLAEAETAASLWEPSESLSPYRTVGGALASARAVLAR